nr:myb/SANT-like domain, Harbinger transposase-derived nuclease domain protein [Tanacetum cinerariifolium]
MQHKGGNLTANRFKFKIKRCSPSGSIRRPVAEKRPSSQNFGVKLIEVEDDVNSFNKEGGSSAASEHVNLDAGYDSSFEDGSSKEPNVARGRRKKKSKKVSELGELEEIMKNAITNIAAQENQGPTMEECHEKLKSMRGYKPTTFNPNPNVPGNNRRERRMFKGMLVPLMKLLYMLLFRLITRGRCDCYHNVLAICDFNMIFTYIFAGWEGTAHDARIFNEALDDLIYEFPIPPSSIKV